MHAFERMHAVHLYTTCMHVASARYNPVQDPATETDRGLCMHACVFRD